MLIIKKSPCKKIKYSDEDGKIQIGQLLYESPIGIHIRDSENCDKVIRSENVIAEKARKRWNTHIRLHANSMGQ